MRVLVVPVGRSTEAVAKAVEHAAPDRVVWFVSQDTESLVEGLIERAEADLRRPLRWNEKVKTPDPGDLQATFAALHQDLARILDRWGCAWDDLVVDITGGTKPMVAALALASIRGARSFQYVSGERDLDGKVQSGTERPVALANPWDALAVDIERDIARDFNALRFRRARELAEQASRRVGDDVRRSYFGKVALLASAFEAWDLFDFPVARDRLRRCREFLAQAWYARPGHGPLVHDLAAADERLREIEGAKRSEAPSRPLLEELLASALRREEEGRYDDAVARLYRFLEGFAQLCLWEAFRIRTGDVPVLELPDGTEWEHARARAVGGQVKLGLRDAYALLAAKGHSAGRAAESLAKGRPLNVALDARNRSLLAHGTTAVGPEECRKLAEAASAVSGIERDQLFRFPRLPES